VEKTPVCVFLIPVVRDSDRRPHPAIVWRLLKEELIRRFGSLTGPETVIYYLNPDPVPGEWLPSELEDPVEDKSRKYTIAIPSSRVDELRSLLRRAGNSFDQRAIYLEVAGYAELVEVDPEDGYLEG